MVIDRNRKQQKKEKEKEKQRNGQTNGIREKPAAVAVVRDGRSRPALAGETLSLCGITV
jgi:hypothetical protein